MPKAEAGSAKAVSNAMKARGLTKLRFYCQVCQKANRDEHAFKMHCESESHMRQLTLVGQNAGKAIDDFSKQFQDEFVSLLSRRFGTKRIKANQVYQEYIQERHHLHMNATRWVTLTEFVKHLGREGIVHVDENEKGWFVAWIDNSPAALKRQAALQKMERQKVDDEGRERKRLQEQIDKAKREEEEKRRSQPDESVAGSVEANSAVEEGLKRVQGPIKLGVSLKTSRPDDNGGQHPPDPAPAATDSSGSKPALKFSSSSSTSSAKVASAPFRLGVNPLKAASKSIPASPAAANPLKSSSSAMTAPSIANASKREPRTMAERIMQEEEERRQKRKSGPMPNSDGMKRIRM